MNKFLSKIKDYFTVLTSPAFWIQNYPYSKQWNKELNRLLDNYRFEYNYPLNDCPNYVSKAEVLLGDNLIWICNYPYGSFPFKNDGISVRPSLTTILKARRMLLDQNLTRLWLHKEDIGKDDPLDSNFEELK